MGGRAARNRGTYANRPAPLSPGPYPLTALLAPAFSLVELMIAIMILGLGLVMVATVFPVGLDMTRDAVQKSIAISAIDTAVETVKIKVPTVHDDIVTASSNVQFTMIRTGVIRLNDPIIVPSNDLVDKYSIENDTAIDSPQESDLSTPPVDNWIDASGAPLPWLNSMSNKDRWAQKTRAFTEQTFWDGDPDPAGTPIPPNTKVAHALRPQNIPADYLQRKSADPTKPVIVTDRVPYIDTFTNPPPTSPPAAVPLDLKPARLRLNEHVYPAIDINADSLAGSTIAKVFTVEDFVESLRKPTNENDRRDADEKLATYASENRRYNWTTFQHRTPLSGTRRSFMLTVVLTYRAELGAAYARQWDAFDTGNQNLRVYLPDAAWSVVPPAVPASAHKAQIEELLFPTPIGDDRRADLPSFAAPPADHDYYDFQDTLYPRPWLVMLYSVNPAAGEVRCSAHVARLLPAGSTFVVARKPGGDTVLEGEFAAGTPHKVLSSSWTRDQLSATPQDLATLVTQEEKLATLQITRAGTGNGLYYVPVWVFPPAILRHPATSGSTSDFGEFATHSPVVGVSMREVTLP